MFETGEIDCDWAIKRLEERLQLGRLEQVYSLIVVVYATDRVVKKFNAPHSGVSRFSQPLRGSVCSVLSYRIAIQHMREIYKLKLFSREAASVGDLVDIQHLKLEFISSRTLSIDPVGRPFGLRVREGFVESLERPAPSSSTPLSHLP